MADDIFKLNLPPLPPPDKTFMEKADTPLANLRGEPGSPMRQATDQMAKEHPWLGGAANTALDTLSSFSSPASLGLAAVTGGAGLLEKTGLSAVPRVLHGVMRVGGAGMAAHGTYKAGKAATDLYQGNGKSTPGDLIAGVTEAGLGALGAGSKGPAAPVEPNADYKTIKGLRLGLDAMRERGNMEGPRTPEGYYLSDEPQIHKALDEHTLRQPDGTIAKDIYDRSGRPEKSYTKDPKGKLPIVSKGLSITDAEKAWNDGLSMVGKEVKQSNALEQAKGGESTIVKQEKIVKKPILDLIEASKTRNLTQDEINQVAAEAKQYPKGVVQGALNELKKNAADLRAKETEAARMNASDASADIDVKQAQQDKLDAELKQAQADSKTASKNQATVQTKDQHTVKMEQDMLSKAQKFNQDNASKRQGEAQAQAAQDAIDEFKSKGNVAAGPQSVTESQSTKGPDGTNQTIRQTIQELPPDKPAPPDQEAGAGGEGPTGGGSPAAPVDPSTLPQEGIRGKKKAFALADSLGGLGSVDVKYNARDGLHYIVPKGGDIPQTPVMKPSLDRDVISLNRYTNQTEAEIIAKHSGGTVVREAPRRYRVKFPDEPASEAPVQGDLPEPTPIQQWANGGEAPQSTVSIPPPSNADLAARAPKEFDTGNLTLEEYRRMMELTPKTPGPNVKLGQTPDEIAEYAALRAKQAGQPAAAPAEEGPFSTVDEPASVVPDDKMNEDAFQKFLNDTSHLDDSNQPFVNPQGEAEPTLPGVEPTVNPDAQPVAEAPFALAGETPQPAAPQAQPLVPDLQKPKASRKAGTLGKADKLADANSGVDSLDFLAQAHGGDLPPDLAQGRGTGPELTPEELKSARRRQSNETRRRKDQAPLLDAGGALPEVPSVEKFAADTKARGEAFTKGMAESNDNLAAKVEDYKKQLLDKGVPQNQIDEWLNYAEKTYPEGPLYKADMLGNKLRELSGERSPKTLEDIQESTGVTTGQRPFQPGGISKPSGLIISSTKNKAPGKLEWTRSEFKPQPETPAPAAPPAEAAPAQPAAPQTDPTALAVQAEIDNPKTAPLERELLKKWLAKFMEEKGEFSWTMKPKEPSDARTPFSNVGTFLNNLHRSTLLSPYSVMKKGIGDVQALGTAALEHPSQTGDILSNILHPDTLEDFKSGWQSPTRGMEDAGKVNGLFQSPTNPLGWSGRTMSGMTSATKGILGRAGFTPEQAGAYTLTNTPSRMFTGPLYETFNKPGFNHLSPFTRIASNWMEQGYEHSPLGLLDLITKSGELSPEAKMEILKKAGVGTAAGGAAYAATPDDFVKEHPVAARMMTAGPLGAPILTGMALKNLTKDSSLPVGKTITNLLDELPGMRLAEDLRDPRGFARNYASSYTNVLRPIAEALDPEDKDISSQDLSKTESLFNKAISNIPIARSTLPSKPEPKSSFASLPKLVF